MNRRRTIFWVAGSGRNVSFRIVTVKCRLSKFSNALDEFSEKSCFLRMLLK